VIPGGQVSAALAAALSLQLRSLAGLERWDPAAALAERVVAGLRGDEGLTGSDLRRLTRWSAAWLLIDSETRAFYATALAADLDSADYAAVRSGLYALLDGASPADSTRGRLVRLHLGLTGREPGVSLTQTPIRRRRTT
jgi:hypothetical protein